MEPALSMPIRVQWTWTLILHWTSQCAKLTLEEPKVLTGPYRRPIQLASLC